MFGLYLLYYFRVFERQIGSNKYSAFILFSVVVPSLFEAVALAFFKASFLVVEKIYSARHMWCSCRSSLSFEYFRHTPHQVPGVCQFIFFATVLAHFGRLIPFNIRRECNWKHTILYRP